MVEERHLNECPDCGQMGIFWHNNGTHSPQYDISDDEFMSICYSDHLTEEDFDHVWGVPDAIIHVYNDESDNPEVPDFMYEDSEEEKD